MRSKPQPARAKKLDMTRPLHTVPAQAAKPKSDKRTTRNKVELAALREEAKRSAATEGGRQSQAAKLSLGQIEAKFGDDEYRKAMRENNLTYKGHQDMPINVLPGKGPVQ
jgi:hypothetical protein